MKRKGERNEKTSPGLRRETLRQLGSNDLQQVHGGYYWVTMKYCAGTWYTYTQ